MIALHESGGFHVAVFEGEEEDPRTPGRMRTTLSLRGTQKLSAYSDQVTLLRHPRGPDAKVALSTLNSTQEAPPEVITASAAFRVQAVRDLYSSPPASTIVGVRSWIEADLEELRFVVEDVPESEIALGDLLLANHSSFLPPLLHVQAYTANDLGEMRSPLTILDGANVPLRHGIHIGSGSQVILLDSATSQATLDLAVGSSAPQFAFYTQDADWPPLHHKGLALTERVSYLRKTA